MKLKLIAIYEVFKKKYVYSLYSILSVILFILGGRDFFDMVRNETTLDFSVTHIATYIAVFVTTFNILYIFYFFKFVDDNHQFGKFINTTDLKCILALFSFGCFFIFYLLTKTHCNVF